MQCMFYSKLCRFSQLAFLLLTITHYYKNPVTDIPHPGSHRKPAAHRQSLSKAAAAPFHSRNMAAGMTLENTVFRPEIFNRFADIKKAKVAQHGVQAG